MEIIYISKVLGNPIKSRIFYKNISCSFRLFTPIKIVSGSDVEMMNLYVRTVIV